MEGPGKMTHAQDLNLGLRLGISDQGQAFEAVYGSGASFLRRFRVRVEVLGFFVHC